jgi:hypothetical protein
MVFLCFGFRLVWTPPNLHKKTFLFYLTDTLDGEVPKNGYRTVLLISTSAQFISEDLLTLFGDGIAAESVVPMTNNLVVTGEEWVNLFNGLKLGQSDRV